MKKQLIMAALGLAMAAGITSGANAAPISGGAAIASEAGSANLAQTVHYRRHNHYGWRRWRPRMFGYMRHRHHHHHHRRHHHYRDYGHGYGDHYHRRRHYH